MYKDVLKASKIFNSGQIDIACTDYYHILEKTIHAK